MSNLRIIVISADDSQCMKSIVVGSNFTGRQFLQIACIQLGISFNENLKMLAEMIDNRRLYVQNDQTLEMQGILNGSSIIIGESVDNFSFPDVTSGLIRQISTFDVDAQYQDFMIPPSSYTDANNQGQLNSPFDINLLDVPPMDVFNNESAFPVPPSMPQPGPETTFNIPIDLTVPEFQSDSADSNDSSETSEETDIVIKNNTFETSEFDTSGGLNFSLGKRDNACRMYTFYEFQDNHDPPLYYDNNFKLKQVISLARQSLQLRNNDYAVLLCFSDNDKRWFEEDKSVEEYSCYDGMAIRIFRKELIISINSIHFETFKFKFNVTDPVEVLLQQIAQQNNIQTPTGYTLITKETFIKGAKMKTHDIPLQLNQDLLHQITDLKELTFGRYYFVFSLKDFQTPQTCMIAYKDAALKIKDLSTKYLSKENAITMVALSYIIENDQNNLAIDKLPDEVGPYLPAHYPEHKSLGAEVRNYLQKISIPDKYNAIRLYIRLVRSLPDFNMSKFKYVPDANPNNEFTVLINPLCVTIVDPKGNIGVRVAYNDITELECEDQTLFIVYHSEANSCVQKTVIRTKRARAIYKEIISFQTIIRNLLMERAQLRMDGKWSGPVSPNDIIRINAYIELTSTTSKEFSLDRNFTGQMMLDILTKSLEINMEDPKNKDLAILIKLRKTFRWVDLKSTLSQSGAYDNCDVFLVHYERDMLVYLPDTTNLTLRMNVQKKSDQLIDEIFEAMKQPFVYGYSLYYKSPEGTFIPISGESSIPEQAIKNNEIYMKRRFFTLTRDDLKNDTLIKSAYYDSREYILTKDISVPENTAAELAVLDYIVKLDNENLENYNNVKETDFNWETVFPKCITVKKSIKKAVMDQIHAHEVIDAKHAMKKYLTIVREIQYFGGESYDIQLRDCDFHRKKIPKTMMDAVIKICPLCIFINDQNGKTLHKIFWRQIVSYEASKKAMRLTFRTSKGDDLINLDIKSKSMQDILMMIKGSWTIFVTVMQLHRKEDERKQEERNRRHAGGYTDNGKVHGPQIDLYVITDLVTRKKTKLIWLDLDMNQPDIVSFLRKVYNTNPKDKYGLMIEQSESYTWILPEMKLQDLDIQELFNLFYLNIRPKIHIADDYGNEKDIVIPLEVPLKDSIKDICQEFGIKQYIGYTLYAPEKTRNNELIPLELNSTIPEQISSFKGIVLRRRFFMVSKLDFETHEATNQIYLDIKRMVNSGVMDISIENATELAYYQLAAEISPLTEKSIPDNCSQYLPKNIKSTGKFKTDIKKFVMQYPDLKPEIAKQNFIELARSIQSFACERYTGYYFTVVKNQNRAHEISIVVTPYRLFVTDKQTQQTVVNIQYEFIVEIEELDGRLCITYTTLNEEVLLFDMESPASKQIKNIIETYYNIKCQLLKLRINDKFNPEEISSGDHVLLYAHIGLHEHKYRSIAFDVRCSGAQLVERLRKLLNLHKTSSYGCLLSFTKTHKVWVRDDEILGIHHPFDGINMYVVPRYCQIFIATENNDIQKVIIDVMEPLHNLIEYIGKRFNTVHCIGYTLFEQHIESLKPLDLGLSLLEQSTLDCPFVFKRRFFMITKFDVKSSISVLFLMNDYKHHIMSGVVDISDSELLELAVYDIYANAKTTPDITKTTDITDMSPYTPKGYKFRKSPIEKLKRLVASAPNMTPIEAARQYILAVRRLINFSCQSFIVVMREDNPDLAKRAKEPFVYSTVSFTISSDNITITNNLAKQVLGKFKINNIVKISRIQNILRITFQSDKSEFITIYITSDQAKEIASVLNNYKKYIIPQTKLRERVQREGIFEPDKIIPRPEEIPIFVYNSLSPDYPVLVFLDPSWTKPMLVKFLAKIFFIGDTTNYNIFTITSDGQILMLDDYNPLIAIGVFPNCCLYFMITNVQIFIQYSNDLITKQYIDISAPTTDICAGIVSSLNLGYVNGFALYSNSNGMEIPLSNYYCIPYQTTNIYDLHFRRRFYAFNEDFVKDSVSVHSLYLDCKEAVLSRNIQVAEVTAQELAILSIYADISSISDFQIISHSIPLETMLPSTIRVTPQIQKSFTALCNSMPRMTNLNAVIKYICTCCQLPGFGTEVHNGKYRNPILLNSEFIDAKIIFSPYSFTVKSAKEDKQLVVIYYNKIISSSFSEDNAWRVKFYNDLNRIATAELKSDEMLIMLSYYDTIMIYQETDIILSIDEFIAKMLGEDDSKAPQASHDEVDSFTSLEIFNDIATMEDHDLEDIKKLSFDAPTLLESVDSGELSESMESQLNNVKDLFAVSLPDVGSVEDYKWRSTSPGLMIYRSGVFMKNAENIFDLISKQVTNLQPQALKEYTNVILDSFSYIRLEELGDNNDQFFQEFHVTYTKLSDVVRTITSSQSNTSFYVNQLRQLIVEIKYNLVTSKARFDTFKNSLISKNMKKYSPLANALYNISNCIEDFVIYLINSTSYFIGTNVDVFEMILTLHSLSQSITHLANSFTDYIAASAFEMQILPQLSENRAKLQNIRIQLSQIKDASPGILAVRTEYKKFLEQILAIDKSIFDVSADSRASVSRQNSIYRGNKIAHHTTAAILINVSTLLEEVMKNSLELAACGIEDDVRDLLKDYVKNVLALANSITKPSAKTQYREQDLYYAYIAITTARTITSKLFNTSNPRFIHFASDINEKLDSAEESMAAMSSINITPWNINTILNDISIMFNLFGQVDPEIFKVTNPELLKQTLEANKKIEEITNEIKQCAKDLEPNPVNGLAIQNAQITLLKLRKMSPLIKENINRITKMTNNQLFQVIRERITTDLDFTLVENPPNEDLIYCQHIFRYHIAQFSFADIINLVAKTCEMDSVASNPVLQAKLKVVMEFLIGQYKEICHHRRLIHEMPFNKEVLYGAAAMLEKSTKFVSILRTVSGDISDISGSSEIDVRMVDTIKIINTSVTTLREAPLRIYRLLPTEKVIQSVKHEIENLIVGLTTIQFIPEISDFEPAMSLIENQKASIIYLLDLLMMEKGESFYTVCEDIQQEVDKIPNNFRVVNKIHQHADVYAIIKDIQNFLKFILKGYPVSLQYVYSEISNVIPQVQPLTRYLNELFFAPELQSDSESQIEITKWRNDLETPLNQLITSTYSKYYTYSKMMRDRRVIASMLDNLNGIPFKLRKKLNDDIKNKLSEILSDAGSAVQRLDVCMKSLPYRGFVNVDIDVFRVIDADEEIDVAQNETLSQYKTFISILESIAEMPQLINKPYTLNYTIDMAKMVRSINEGLVSCIHSEKQMIMALEKAKDVMAKVVSSVELIAPVLYITKFLEATKNLVTNTNTFHKMLTRPHLNDQTAVVFTNRLLPHLKSISDAINSNSNTMKFSSNMKKSMLEFNKYLNEVSVKIETMAPKAKQVVCDTLYAQLSSMLPQTEEFANVTNLYESMLSMFDVLGNYTGCSKVEISYTQAIQLKMSPLSNDTIKDFVNQVSKFCSSTQIMLPRALLDAAYDLSSVIIEFATNIPEFITTCIYNSKNCLESYHSSVIASLALCIVHLYNDANRRSKAIEELFVSTITKTSLSLNSLKIVINSIQVDQIKEVETKYWILWLKEKMNDIDTKLIINGHSMSVCMILNESLHHFAHTLYASMQSLNFSPELKTIKKQLFAAINEYLLWLHSSDLVLQNYLYAEFDFVIFGLETIKSDDSQMMSNAGTFIREAVQLLRRKDRLITQDIICLSQVISMISKFNEEFSSHFQSDNNDIHAIIQDINSIIPSIKLNFFLSFTSIESFMPIVSNSASYILCNINECLINAVSSPAVFVFRYSIINSRLSALEYAYSNRANAKIDENIENDFEQLFKSVHIIATSNNSQGSMRVQFIQIIIQILEKLAKSTVINIDYTKLPDNTVESNAAQFNIETIGDESCEEYAQAILDTMRKLQEEVSNLESTEDESGTSQSEQSKSQVTNTLISSINNMTNNDVQFDNINDLMTGLKDIILQNELLRFITASRLCHLKQSINMMFPEISKIGTSNTLSVANMQESANKVSKEIETLGNKEKFEQMMSILTNEKAIDQFNLLRVFSDKVINNDLPIHFMYMSLKSYASQFLTELRNIDSNDENFIKNSSLVLENIAVTTAYLLALINSLIQNNKQIFNYMQTSECKELFRQPITVNEVFMNQPKIIQQIEFLNTPDMLDQVQEKMSMEEIMIQIRLIRHLIHALINGYMPEITQTNVTVSTVMKALCEMQVAEAKSSSSFLNNSPLFDNETIDKTQDYITAIVEKVDFMNQVTELFNTIRLVYPDASIRNTRATDSHYKEVSNLILDLLTDKENINTILNNNKNIENILNVLQHIVGAMNTNEFMTFTASKVSSHMDAINNTMMSIEHEISSSLDEEIVVKRPYYFLESIAVNLKQAFEATRKSRMFTSLLNTIVKKDKIQKALGTDKLKERIDSKNSGIISSLIESYSTSDIVEFNHKLNNMDEAAMITLLSGVVNNLSNSSSITNDKLITKFLETRSMDCATLATLSKLPYDSSDDSTILDQINHQNLKYQVAIELLQLTHQRAQYSKILGKISANEKSSDEITNHDLISEINDFSSLAKAIDSRSTEQNVSDQIVLVQLANAAIKSSTLDKFDIKGNKVTKEDINEAILKLVDEQKNIKKDALTEAPTPASLIASISKMQAIKNQCTLSTNLIHLYEVISTMKSKDSQNKTYTTLETVKSTQIIKSIIESPMNDETIKLFFSNIDSNTVNCTISTLDSMIHAFHASIMNNNLITNQEFAVPSLEISTISNLIKPPSAAENLGLCIHTLSGILKSLPSIGKMTVNECSNIISTEITSVLNALRSLLYHRSASYPPEMKIFADELPSMFAASIKVYSSLNDEQKKLFSTDPKKIMNDIIEIMNASASLNDPVNLEKFHKSIAEISSFFFTMNSVTAKDLDTSVASILSHLSSAMKARDIDRIMECTFQIESIHKYMKFNNQDNEQINSIMNLVKEIDGYGLYTTPGKYTDINSHLDEKRKKLNKFLTSITPNLGKILSELSSIDQINEIIYDTVKSYNNNINNFMTAFKRNDVNLIQSTSALSAFDACKCFTSTTLGIKLSNCANETVYKDVISKYHTAFTSMKNVRNLLTEGSNNFITAKRAIRALTRLIESCSDALEDADSESWTTKPTADLAKAKVEFLSTLNDINQTVMVIASTAATAMIPESFDDFVGPQTEKVMQLISKLSEIKEKLNEYNVDQDAFTKFDAVFTEFNNIVSKSMSEISYSPSIFETCSKISMSSINLTEVLETLIDVVPQVPDLENAEKLPKNITLPHIPAVINIAPTKAFNIMQDACVTPFDLLNKINTMAFKYDNAKLAEMGIELVESIKQALKTALMISATSTTLNHQQRMTSLCASVCNDTNSLIEALRSKFLLRGDWKQAVNLYFGQIAEELMMINQISSEVEAKAIEDESTRDKLVKSYVEVLTPLQSAIRSLDSAMKELNETQTTTATEWTKQLMTAYSAISHAAESVVMYSKEKKQAKTKAIFAFAKNVTKEISSALNETKSAQDDIENIVIKRVTSVAGITQQFIENSQSTSPEESTLRDALGIALRSANSLAKAAEKVIEMKKKKSEMKSAVHTGQAREWLLKRLELESKVIQARMQLEHYEQQLSSIQ